MKFTIITPCRNAAGSIGRTLDSIVGQSALASGDAELQLLVVDGASTDETAGIARGYPQATVISEPDKGMYDALCKGLRMAEGDVVAYLNAGDIYSPTAFQTVRTIFRENSHVRWLTGCCCYANERGEMISFSRPKAYARSFIEAGLYDGQAFPCIQQESTFWKRDLIGAVDFEKLAGLRLAGDFFLWMQIARQAELHTVYSHLASFSYQKGQLSENSGAYRAEIQAVRPPVQKNIEIAAKRERSNKRWRWAWSIPVAEKPKYGGVYYYDIKNHLWTTTPEAACP